MIQTVDISITHNNIFNKAKTAYNNFEGRQIPFAAVRLNICLQNTCKKEIDEIVEDNFRSENDLIFKECENYLILMEKTTIEAAEKAVNRLKTKVSHIIARNFENLKDSNLVCASAYILGSARGANKISFKYLDLNPILNSLERKIHKMPFGYGEYLRWFELAKSQSFKINKMINIVV